LSEELELLERYLDIERIRFADRLAITVDVPESALGARVPPFSLQPLVENAIRHGVSRRPLGGQVVVSARQFAEWSGTPGNVLHAAAIEGKVVYEAA
jgi:two-component system LytT family sensor kinase